MSNNAIFTNAWLHNFKQTASNSVWSNNTASCDSLISISQSKTLISCDIVFISRTTQATTLLLETRIVLIRNAMHVSNFRFTVWFSDRTHCCRSCFKRLLRESKSVIIQLNLEVLRDWNDLLCALQPWKEVSLYLQTRVQGIC